MSIKATRVGRDLHIEMEGVDGAFVIRPLPARASIQMTNAYLDSYMRGVGVLLPALQMAVDGARKNAETGEWEPLPEAEQVNFNRMGDELSQREGESVMMPAFFWQTVLGMDGVKAYIEGGEGLAGTLKATGALSQRLGLLAPRTSPEASATA